MTRKRSDTPRPAVRALVERWHREGMPAVRLLAGEPLHERGLRLSCDEWSAVIFSPFVCEALGQEWPAWAALCTHAAAVRHAVPPALLDALLVADHRQAGTPRNYATAALGAALDLCVAFPHVGPERWIAVCEAVPPALLDALCVAGHERTVAPCDHETAALGVALDLCITSPHVGPGAWISITPFGHGVALLHQLALDAQAAEHGDG